MTIEEIEKLDLNSLSLEELDTLKADVAAKMSEIEMQLSLVDDALKWRMLISQEGPRVVANLMREADEPVAFAKEMKKTPATIESECLFCKKLFNHYQSVPQLYCSRRCFHADANAMARARGTAPAWGLFSNGNDSLVPRVNIRKIFPKTEDLNEVTQ